MDILGMAINNPREIISEAIYYCIRALKQAPLPPTSQKDYFHDSTKSHPTKDGVTLAKRILSEISRLEGSELSQIPEKRIHQYISMLSDANSQITRQQLNFDSSKGAKLLRKFRKK
jgi:hypothetical protein